MTIDPPCGRARCPVPTPDSGRLQRLRTVTWHAGTRLRRGHSCHHPDPTELVPGVGDSRFAPLGGAAHAYVATTTVAALLESAFHDAAPPDPRIPEVVVARWCEAEVVLAADVRLIDLRDPQLARLGLDRDELTSTSAAHYPCTRTWAAALHGRVVGGHPTHGLVWHSRQIELHARAMASRPALADLLDAHPGEVAVLWAPPAPLPLLQTGRDGLGVLRAGPGRAYVDDLIGLLGIVSQ